MNIVIFGANGATGRLLTRRVLDAGHSAVAVTRRPGDFPLTDPALSVVGADVHDAAALVDVVAGADAVISTLGVPFTRESVDTYSVGTANIVAAMHKADTRRLVVVSSTGAFPAPDVSMRRSRCGSSNRSSPAPSARPCMTTCVGWKPSCATAVWTQRSCARRGCSTCLCHRIRCRRG